MSPSDDPDAVTPGAPAGLGGAGAGFGGAPAGLDARVVVRRAGFLLDATLRVPAGEVVALMGPSGAGKSTLLGVLAGLTAFDEGSVRLRDRTLDADPRRRTPPASRGVVLLGQDARLFPHLTAQENVAFGLRVRGASKSAAAAGAAQWLRRVGLADHGGRRPAKLSGGQQQRVALARALATEPAVILLDEPLTSLDTETAGDVRALLHRQLSETRTAAIVATHDAVDAVALASRLVVLEDGRVTQSGPVREVLAAPATRFAAAVAGLNRVVGRVVAPPGASGASGSSSGASGAGGAGASGSGGAAGPAVTAAAWHAGALMLEASIPPAPGEAAAVFRPGDVRIVDGEPSGPGEWRTRIVRLEQTPAGVRVRTAVPDVAVDVPAGLAAGLDAGQSLTLRLDPADVRFLVGQEGAAGEDAGGE
ncbi:ATP-binding cassette domain-containing protein [Microbacterium sp. NEAU-LLC]|uniref:ATP-binding cassette domain-containing protein n=1 Tax=Microbacterium helvum TaxID=2773713 RepID=A0ABR8NK54_9MICO|nr:ATP-binding cassette domain-containing protein [Microbacterium helvum]MBD3940162.1 ATP-binding cassette domain-containing protein [Microbacterium helvum]